MRLGVIQQQPNEYLSYTVNYEDALTQNDTIASATVTCDPEGVTIDVIDAYSPRVRFWATGGVDKQRYKITVSATTAQGRVFEDELTYVVREV